MDVGARIKELRLARKLTQRKLAALSNISQPVITRMEKNSQHANVATIEILCGVFGISLSQFFDINGSLLEALPVEIRGFVLDPANVGLVRALKEMVDAGYSKEGIVSWLRGLQETVTGLAQKGLLDGQVYFDPVITEDASKR